MDRDPRDLAINFVAIDAKIALDKHAANYRRTANQQIY